MNRDNQKGVTLLELMLAILIFGILMTVVGNFFLATYKNYTRFNAQKVLTEEMRMVNEFIAEEIRLGEIVEVKYTPTNPAAKPGEKNGRLEEITISDFDATGTAADPASVRTLKLEKVGASDAYLTLTYSKNGSNNVVSNKIKDIIIKPNEFEDVIGVKTTVETKVLNNIEVNQSINTSLSLKYKNAKITN